MKAILSLALSAATLIGVPAAAQSPTLAQAIQAGQAGERYDGYLGIASTAPPQVERQVRAINIQRRNLYIELSTRRNVSPELVGMTAGCQLLRQLAVGEAYMLNDRVWRRRAPGQTVPLPDYCR